MPLSAATDGVGQLVLVGYGAYLRRPFTPNRLAFLPAGPLQGQAFQEGRWAGRQQAATHGRDVDADPDDRRFAQQDTNYLDGVAATLAWVLGDRPEAPIMRSRPRELTTKDLKAERVHAEDVIEQAKNRRLSGVDWTAPAVRVG
jgi:hypothetical protein